MAYRRTSYRKSSWRKLKPSDVLPLWTPAHTSLAQLGFQVVMQKLSITDVPSYYAKLRPLIISSMVLGAAIGAAADHGITGFSIGVLLGFMAPAALIFVGVTLVVVAIFLAVFCGVWALIIWGLWWLLQS